MIELSLNKCGEKSYWDVEDIYNDLNALKEYSNKEKSEEEDLEIWYTLKEIAKCLEEYEVMNLPYAKKYYPLIIKLCDEIRRQLKLNLAGASNKPQSWKLFRVE